MRSKPLGAVEQHELSALLLRLLGHLLSLQGDFSLVHLPLTGHRHVFAGRHGERARQQTSDPGQQDRGAGGARSGEAHHQRRIGHQSVADAEHCGPQAAGAVGAVPGFPACDLLLRIRSAAINEFGNSAGMAAFIGCHPRCGIGLLVIHAGVGTFTTLDQGQHSCGREQSRGEADHAGS
jgi:hypothetical protein